MIIAIDGLAASGKSSTAKLLAKKLGFIHFSTGKMYRAITSYIINNQLDNTLPNSIINIINQLNFVIDGINFDNIYIDNTNYSDNLYTDKINSMVSTVSSISHVRKRMVEIQRKLAKNNNVVCEGRDIGTVVFPDADFKFFFKASLASRSQRRYLEMKKVDPLIAKYKVKDLLKNRDFKDINRIESPLMKAKGSIVIITTNMTLNEQIDFIYRKIKIRNTNDK